MRRSSISPELRALIERAAVYIGGDSGPLHIAATTTMPIVALYGPTLPGRSVPWRDATLVRGVRWTPGRYRAGPCHQRVCEPGDFRCLTAFRRNRLPPRRNARSSAPPARHDALAYDANRR